MKDKKSIETAPLDERILIEASRLLDGEFTRCLLSTDSKSSDSLPGSLDSPLIAYFLRSFDFVYGGRLIKGMATAETGTSCVKVEALYADTMPKSCLGKSVDPMELYENLMIGVTIHHGVQHMQGFGPGSPSHSFEEIKKVRDDYALK